MELIFSSTLLIGAERFW